MKESVAKPLILVVEDESAIVTMLKYNLEHNGFRVNVATDGEEAMMAVDEQKPDLILLDWMLPSISGVQVCERLRIKDNTRLIPIIMLTARGEESDRIRGLDSGADDYMTKPFSPNELVARINALLRRTRPVFASKSLSFGGITVDLNTHRVSIGKEDVHLGPTEFRLLCHFLETPNQVFSREQLLDAVWGYDIYVELRTVDVHVRRLRKSLGDTKKGLDDIIKTLRSVGYVMEALPK
jgi:two-component system phosphate regulon response regulator PhoB